MLHPANLTTASAFQPHEGEIGYGIRPMCCDQQAERQPGPMLAALALPDFDVAGRLVRQLLEFQNPVLVAAAHR